MAEGPLDLPLEFVPRARFDVVDLRSHLPIEYRDALASYLSCLYWSAHTTAGFLDRSLAARLGPARVPTYVDALRSIFPEGAGYAHDRVERRQDLDDAQRAVEPRNADSHLAFIAGGLRSCVTHPNRSGEAVYFVDLDGVNEGHETLLMQHDLAAVLRDPLRFMAKQSWSALANPRAVPGKVLGYAKYDLVRVLNSSLETLGLNDSIVEKVLARTLAVPAARFFRIRRSVHLLVAERDDGRRGFVEGPYQSPILVQWQRAPRPARVLDVTLTRLE